MLCLLLALTAPPALSAPPPDRDWAERYQDAQQATQGGLIASLGGTLVASGGAVTMLAMGGCEAQDGVCTGPWVGDPLVLAGYALAFGGAFTMSSNSVKGRNALTHLPGVQAPSAVWGTSAWIFSLGALGTGALSLQVARPGEHMPKLLAVGREDWLYATGGLLVLACTSGALQRRANRDAAPVGLSSQDPPGSQLVLAPWTTGRASGLGLVGSF